MDDNGSEASKGKKRHREAEEEEDSANDIDQILSLGNAEKNLTFSDTMVGLRIMRAQFPRNDKVTIPPFILRSQLYSSIEDRTQVDRELESLKQEKVLRIFKLNTGQDDHAIMFLDDYLNQIERIVTRFKNKKLGNIEVFEWFRTHVIDLKMEPSIGHLELCSLLSLGGKVKDEDISLLINAGLLARQVIDPSTYWFTIPSIGSVLKGLSQGRKELLSLLNRQKFKEISLASLERKRLRMSPLDIRFHLRDLIGSGHLKKVHTPMGLVIQLSKD